MNLVRAVVFQLAFVGWTLVVAVVLLPLSPFLDGAGMRRWARRWEGGVLVLLRRLAGITLEVRGTPPQEPSLLASKHQSALETVVYHRLVPDIAIPLKVELTRIPLFGRYVLRAGCIAVEREAATKAMRALMQAAKERMDGGLSLLIFPEGTRVPPGERQPYRSGIFALYSQLDRPVVPVALHTGHVWPKGLFTARPGHATIEFLEPIPPGMERKPFMKLLEDRIETASAALAAEGGRRKGRKAEG
ncbi:MAG: 1-acyl-sn-glycerol-3-phosphate acyltransferase [Geminicoccaceae bacterium]|nr:MAG: 1-acyl-sn-glycerol-3-phosphate acyltransferase [Geminicoccaceae bacterium]